MTPATVNPFSDFITLLSHLTKPGSGGKAFETKSCLKFVGGKCTEVQQFQPNSVSTSRVLALKWIYILLTDKNKVGVYSDEQNEPGESYSSVPKV